MKWDCGPTPQERAERMRNWHVWFAWYPVRVGPHDCRWLENVERTVEWCYDCRFVNYRPLGE
jgi:hypothetical protein